MQETLDAQSADIDMVSGATVTSDGYLESLQCALDQAGCVTAATAAAAPPRVTSSTSWACRSASRCAAGTPTTPRAAPPGRAAMAELREVDRVFSTYRRRLGRSPGSDRGELGLDDCPPEVRRGARARRRAPSGLGGASASAGRAPTAPRRSTRAAWSRAGPWSARAAALRALDDTDFCLSAGGDVARAAPSTRTRRLADRHRGPARPAPADRRRPAPQRRGRDLRHRHRGAHLVDARTGRPPAGVASVTVVARDADRADIDATAAYALGPEAAAWLARPVGRTGLVVWADGTTTTVGRAA